MPILERRALGKSGIEVTSIGLGGGGIGGEFGRVKEAAAIWTVRKAIANGVNLLDCSPAYGDSETWIGKAVTRTERSRTLFSTHITAESTAPSDIASDIESSIQTSLERLRTDTIDLLALHRWVFNTASGVWTLSADAVLQPGGYLECLQSWKQKGVVRAIGFTAYGDYEAVQKLMASGGFDYCEVEFSLLHRNAILEGVRAAEAPERPTLLQLARQHELGVLGIRPLAGGMLAGRFTPGRGDASTVRDRHRAAVLQQQLGNLPLAQAAITFAAMQPDISSVLVGARQPEEIEAAVNWSRLPPHPEEFLAQLDRFHEQALI